MTTGSVSPVSLAEASRFWFQLGWVSFGGPAGQIALLHRELVDRRRWLSERRYLHALNYCMLLPGPEAMQLATYLGWLMHGVPGGLIAGGLFVIPSVFVLTALASIYALWGQLPLLASVFAVVKPAVLAIVLMAAWRIGRRTLHTPLLVALAVAGFLALALLDLPYPVVVISAGLIGIGAARWRPNLLVASKPHGAGSSDPNQDRPGALHDDDSASPDHARFSKRQLAVTLLVWALALLLPLAALAIAGGWSGTLALMARFFTRVALLSFGGAYAVLPYVAQGAVEQFNWLSAPQMLDGLALGETTPGPLIMVVAFVGFMGGWNQSIAAGLSPWPLALAAVLVTVWFTFLPSIGFILAGAPLVEATRGDLRFGAPLSAITAVVVGVIASLALFFAGPVLWSGGIFNPWAAVVVALALFAQLRLRWSVLQVIGAAAAIGAVLAGVAALSS
ncbi:chromate efflux transporter [Cyanobium sp. BA20m-14]|uniref:chromate efflux transporter n=1 Tax=Cyanobium sp. BA20m-14 TaxID=2823703 RepID=UPI0020CE1D74|nr:chromate efflux transporter [Cyanobium sp. BA20m-14]MCP9914343.1 chromate efflux transporter [Cyanobium sp. BA20m-14]